MCQPKKEKLSKKEEIKQQKKEVQTSDISVTKTDKRIIELHDPTLYYLKD